MTKEGISKLLRECLTERGIKMKPMKQYRYNRFWNSIKPRKSETIILLCIGISIVLIYIFKLY